MATRLGPILVALAISVVAVNLPSLAAVAASLDAKAEAEAKEASRLYKEGSYDEAAKMFSRLTVEYPDMPIFERNLGACFYYLRRPEPALSNLRGYLNHRKDVPDDDRATVERWIDEMEKLRAQNAAAAPATATATTTTTATTTPAGVDLSAALPAPVESPPIYKTWWFWTGVGAVVVAGTVTAILLAHRSNGACDGESIACMGVK